MLFLNMCNMSELSGGKTAWGRQIKVAKFDKLFSALWGRKNCWVVI